MNESLIDWDKVRDIGDPDLVLIDGGYKRDPDTGEIPEGLTWLGFVPIGDRIEDASGNRFRVMAAGPVQGACILRDRGRRMFCADIDVIVKPIR